MKKIVCLNLIYASCLILACFVAAIGAVRWETSRKEAAVSLQLTRELNCVAIGKFLKAEKAFYLSDATNGSIKGCYVLSQQNMTDSLFIPESYGADETFSVSLDIIASAVSIYNDGLLIQQLREQKR